MKKLSNAYLGLAVLALQSVFVHGAAPADDEAKELHAELPSYAQAVRDDVITGGLEREILDVLLSTKKPHVLASFSQLYYEILENKAQTHPQLTNKLRSYVELALMKWILESNRWDKDPGKISKMTAHFALRYYAELLVAELGAQGAQFIRAIAQVYNMEPAEPGLAATLEQIANES